MNAIRIALNTISCVYNKTLRQAKELLCDARLRIRQAKDPLCKHCRVNMDTLVRPFPDNHGHMSGKVMISRLKLCYNCCTGAYVIRAQVKSV